jgi:hypothetical protein
MTKTATALSAGPFGGLFGAHARLYRLEPELNMFRGTPVPQVIIATLGEDEDYPAETYVYAATAEGELDVDFYVKHQHILTFEEEDIPRALRIMGYTKIIEQVNA